MQFSYRITEEQYRRAVKLRFGANSRSRVAKTIMFWVFILVCLLMLWTVVTRNAETRATSDPSQTSDQTSVTPDASAPAVAPGHSLLVNVGPFVLILAIWVFMLLRLAPRRWRALYLKDPAMQGEFTIDVTPASLSIRNTAGLTSSLGWNFYEYWRESQDLIVLAMRSTAYFMISLEGLSDSQRGELRSILASVLPKK